MVNPALDDLYRLCRSNSLQWLALRRALSRLSPAACEELKEACLASSETPCFCGQHVKSVSASCACSQEGDYCPTHAACACGCQMHAHRGGACIGGRMNCHGCNEYRPAETKRFHELCDVSLEVLEQDELRRAYQGLRAHHIEETTALWTKLRSQK